MIQVRRSIYRGQPGWTISGTRPGQQGGFPVRLFTLTEVSARHIAAQVRAGVDIGLDDFNWSEQAS